MLQQLHGRAVLAVLIGCYAARALAFAPDGGVFMSDFESGTLLTSDVPGGVWESRTTSSAANWFAATADAGHRGSFAGRMYDSATGSTWAATLGMSGRTYSTSAYVRFWLRVRAPKPASSTWIGVQFGPISIYFNTNNQVGLVCSDAQSTWKSTHGPELTSSGPAGKWQLHELYVSGLGTATGRIQVWIDGTFQSELNPIDLTGMDVDYLQVGNSHSDVRTYAGFVDFDDVRVSAVPLAQTLTLALPPSTAVGQCLHGTVGLVSLLGQPQPPLFDADVEIDAGVGNTVFGNAACSSPSATVRIGAGQTSADFWVAPSQTGSMVATATFIDFIEAPAANVLVTSGSPSFLVGCDCAAAGGGAGMVVAVAFAALVRGRRGRPSTTPPARA